MNTATGIPWAKYASSSEPIAGLLASRWSPRSLDASRPIPSSAIHTLLEAARWAPSCRNEQPWSYLVFERRADAAAWQRVVDCLVEGNRKWAQSAPVFFIANARSEFLASGEPNRWAQYDTGAASENICLQGAAMGLAVHQMGGFDEARVRAAFAVPDNYTPMAVIAVAYPAAAEELPKKYQQQETATRARHSLAEFCFTNTWNEQLKPAVAKRRGDGQ